MKQRHIGVLGPCNPYELRDYITNTQEVIRCNNAATSVTTYIKELVCSGFKVTVFSFYPAPVNKTIYYTGGNFEMYMVAANSRIRGVGLPFRLIRLKKELNQHIATLDILHAQWTYEYALVAKSFAKKIPVFCTVRDWCPYIMTLTKTFSSKILWYVNYLIFKNVMSSKEIHFIANSTYTYNCITAAFPEKHVELIPNPISKGNIVSERKTNPPYPVFISIAQSVESPRKNIIQLLRAFSLFKKRHDKAELIIVGAYNANSGIITEAKREGLSEGVSFVGSVKHDMLFEYIDKCTCLVHPAFEETFGNILLEAMARKVVCIGGEDSGAVPEVLGYGERGILCDIKDPLAICEAMEKSLDKDLVTQLIDSASAALNNLYRSDINMQKIIDVYRCSYK